MKMPEPDRAAMAQRGALIETFSAMLPDGSVIADADELRVYESDGLTAYGQRPMLVVLPETVDQVSAILKCCHERNVKVVPRGAGTGLSG
ncbi:MAG: FAD-binding protein, partial [Alphaproteobacteria bacterium]